EINYHKHYVDSIEQLNLLMNKTKKTLPKIKKPILIIQGKDDPVVNPSSAHEIFERISSRYKTLKIIDSKKHVIVTEYNEELFYLILNFIKSE
ncbi:MAG: alpha/beta hydrolase, partial [Arcobacter sp.]